MSERPTLDETPDVFADRAVAELAADFVTQFSHPVRLKLLCRLVCGGRYSVSELVRLTGEEQATVSKQLKQLHLARFVDRERVGTNVYYSVTDPLVGEAMRFLGSVVPRLRRPSGWAR
jgi:ArsR family transcriptional regulator